jgi:hypothetical protein
VIEGGLGLAKRWLIALAVTTACSAGGEDEPDETKVPAGGSGGGAGSAALGGTGGAGAGCPVERPAEGPCVLPESNFCGPYSTGEACVCSGEMPTWMCFGVGS